MDDNATADCIRSYLTMKAPLHVATQRPDEDIEASILHEAIHLALAEMDDWGCEAIDTLDPEIKKLLKKRLLCVEERIVRRFERVLAEILSEKEAQHPTPSGDTPQ